jgi:hypothetical protein
MASINVDIEVSEILWNLSSYEKQELTDDLFDEGYTPNNSPDTIESSNDGEEFDVVVSKLLGNSWKLTKEDEETILRIANKIIV